MANFLAYASDSFIEWLRDTIFGYTVSNLCDGLLAMEEKSVRGDFYTLLAYLN